MRRPRAQGIRYAAALLLMWSTCAAAEPAQINTIRDVLARLRTCWRPPAVARANPGIDITVMVSFNRAGEILGHPRITYQS